MDRREFLTLASKLAAATALPASLYGCGGSGGSSASTGATTSSVDTKVASINTQQTEIDVKNSELSSDLNSDLVESPATSQSLLRNAESDSMSMAQFFATRTPNMFIGLDNSDIKPYPQAHYLDAGSNSTGAEFWQNAINSHDQAYKDYQQQTTKLLATLRLFDAKNSEFVNTNPPQTNSANIRASSVEVDEEAQSYLNSINGFSLPENLLTSSGLLAGLTTLLVNITSYLVNTSFIQALLDATLGLISKALEAVKATSLEDLQFDSRNNILLSFAKMSVASAAVLGLKNINDVDSQNENDFVQTNVSSTDVLNKLTLKWLSLAQGLVNETVTASTNKISDYGDQEASFDGADATIKTQLQTGSSIMAMTSLAIKSVYNNFAEQAEDVTNTATGFTGTTAEEFKPLFTSSSNSYDQLVTDNSSGLLVNRTELTEQLGYQESSIVVRTATPASSSTEADEIYEFAQELASVETSINPNTATPSLSLTEQLAKYAFDFTMDIEDDAYNFAMQGMEYGYLFASRGEEVGVMADRILWMAVQIGVMADRIGEMADRIVYVSQLIVYTEILILDFGILIYGVIKQISNSMLMALALILDREWYGDVAIEQASSEDVVLSTIGANVTQMLSNMNEYSQAVIDNQRVLRESTQSAINTIDFASSIEA